VSFTPWPLYYRGNNFNYTLSKILLVPRAEEEEKDLLPLPGIEVRLRGSPSRSLVFFTDYVNPAAN